MFGGAGIYRDGRMFALVADGEVFLKSDKSLEPRFLAAGCRKFVYEKDGKKIAMSYWSLPEAALDDAEALKDWAEATFQAALGAAEPRRAR